jgi:SPP1 family predicted phage head-tail adaptor
MRAGELQHRVALQTQASTQDTFGAPAGAWSTAMTVWAKVEAPGGGSEAIVQERAEAIISHVVTLRYREGITAAMRAVWRGKTLQIQSVAPDNNLRYIVLQCREVVGENV